MKQLIKFLNLFIFIISLSLFFIVKPYENFSYDLSTLLGANDKKFYQLSQKFNNSSTLLLATEGYDKSKRSELNNLKLELLQIPEVTSKNKFNNKNLQEFKKRYQFYLNDFNYKHSGDIETKEILKSYYDRLLTSTLYVNINKDDPLNIIKKNNSTNTLSLKNGHLSLADYGYLEILHIQSNLDAQSKVVLYDKIHNVLTQYQNINYHSSLFYYVENSKKIQSDVNKIITISLVLLGVLYLILLRNFYLFLNVTLTLVSSVLIGELIISSFFNEVSIISLAFSIAITSISIDYMFHHYLHNYYEKGKLVFNKSVFYGFMTTVSAFGILSFIDFQLIKQISIFSIISLFVAYLHFAFLYPYLGIKYISGFKMTLKPNREFLSLSSLKIVIFSFLILILSLFYVKFDFNIKNINYQNEKLIKSELFFSSKMNQDKKSMILITADNIDTLIHNAKLVQNIDNNSIIPISTLLSKNEYNENKNIIHEFDFKQLKNNLENFSDEVGFRKGYFTDSYNNHMIDLAYPVYSLEMIDELGYDVLYSNNIYFSYAFIDSEKIDEVLSLSFVKNAQAKLLFENLLKKVYDDLLIYGTLTIFCILMILFVVTRRNFLKSFTFILFPISLMLFYGIFVPLNIMNIFMMFIILAIAIDYGIYVNEKELLNKTKLAIVYSLMSTFAGFGILIISDINALYSIAITALIGIFSILLLLRLQR